MELGLDKWQAQRRALTRESFLRKYAHPFLFCADWQHATRDDADADEMEYHTATLTRETLSSLRRPDLSHAVVAPVVKGNRNPFEFISLGRAANCDIVLADASVSKMHAYLKVLSAGEAELTDTGSRNGTVVNGARLAKRTPVRLQAGHKIVVGRIPLELLDPSGLYALL